jgi:hypothetical protein
MVLSDNEKNVEFLYAYVKDFKWHNNLDNEQFHGHPMKGHIYRLMHNKDTKSYRLFYDSVNGGMIAIMLPSLTDVEDGYRAKLVPISKKNIVSLDLSEDNLEVLVKWLENDNKDLKKFMGFGEEKNKLVRISSKEKEVADFVMSASEMYQREPVVFEALQDLLVFITERGDEDSMESIDLSFSKEHGAGINISKSFNLLARYIGEDKRKSFMSEDLLEAIYTLLNEHARNNFHNNNL